MKANTQQILINSILGGQSKYVNYAAEDEFLHSYNIDPDISVGFTQSEGVISPTGLLPINQTAAFSGPPLWILTNPKDTAIFLYNSVGSVYAGYRSGSPEYSFPASSSYGYDLTEAGSASGNGASYYDNYMYFARDTTIARIGPMDAGFPWTITKDYWVTTLGKTALTNTSNGQYYEGQSGLDIDIPNHILHRHSDGKLYIGDVVGNQGYIHYISTTKTTVEGDTDNGSTYQALDLPFGLYPTAMASYGSDLAIALKEGASPSLPQRARLSFWDTTSNNYSLITSVEFPDPIIYALLNSNGVLYVFSGQGISTSNDTTPVGVRITRFVGGYTFEQVAYIDSAIPPLAGAVEGYLNKILFGGADYEPVPTDSDGNTIPAFTSFTARVASIGSKKSPVSLSLFNIMGCSSTASSTASTIAVITAIKLVEEGGMDTFKPLTGWTNGLSHGGDITYFDRDASYSPADLGGGTIIKQTSYGPPSVWRSKVYRIGQKFKITKISIPFAQRFEAPIGGPGNTGLTVGILRDGLDNESNYVRLGDFVGASEYKNRLIIRPNGLVCDNRFILELVLTSSNVNPYPVVGLPIKIDIEIYDD